MFWHFFSNWLCGRGVRLILDLTLDRVNTWGRVWTKVAKTMSQSMAKSMGQSGKKHGPQYGNIMGQSMGKGTCQSNGTNYVSEYGCKVVAT